MGTTMVTAVGILVLAMCGVSMVGVEAEAACDADAAAMKGVEAEAACDAAAAAMKGVEAEAACDADAAAMKGVEARQRQLVMLQLQL